MKTRLVKWYENVLKYFGCFFAISLIIFLTIGFCYILAPNAFNTTYDMIFWTVNEFVAIWILLEILLVPLFSWLVFNIIRRKLYSYETRKGWIPFINDDVLITLKKEDANKITWKENYEFEKRLFPTLEYDLERSFIFCSDSYDSNKKQYLVENFYFIHYLDKTRTTGGLKGIWTWQWQFDRSGNKTLITKLVSPEITKIKQLEFEF